MGGREGEVKEGRTKREKEQRQGDGTSMQIEMQ